MGGNSLRSYSALISLASIAFFLISTSGCDFGNTKSTQPPPVREPAAQQETTAQSQVGESSQDQITVPGAPSTPDSSSAISNNQSRPQLAYQLFVPSGVRKAKALPLVVMIHGCKQSAGEIALGTGWSDVAEREKFLVLYPNQTAGRHASNCWRWFDPANQVAGSGEADEIVAAIHDVQKSYAVDKNKIYVAGMSSGAATVSILLACYPKMFRAGALHSGPSYGLASNENDGLKVIMGGPSGWQKQGPCEPRDHQGGVMVVQGINDILVNFINASRVIEDFVGQVDSRNSALPMAFGTLLASQSDYLVNGKLKGRKILVNGLGHEWSGGRSNMPFNNPLGPNATELMWSFFSKDYDSKDPAQH